MPKTAQFRITVENGQTNGTVSLSFGQTRQHGDKSRSDQIGIEGLRRATKSRVLHATRHNMLQLKPCSFSSTLVVCLTNFHEITPVAPQCLAIQGYSLYFTNVNNLPKRMDL